MNDTNAQFWVANGWDFLSMSPYGACPGSREIDFTCREKWQLWKFVRDMVDAAKLRALNTINDVDTSVTFRTTGGTWKITDVPNG